MSVLWEIPTSTFFVFEFKLESGYFRKKKRIKNRIK